MFDFFIYNDYFKLRLYFKYNVLDVSIKHILIDSRFNSIVFNKTN